MKAYIKRIKAVNPLINALTDERFSSAIEEAKQLDRNIAQHLSDPSLSSGQAFISKQLLGIPISVKECHAVKGLSFTSGLYSRRHIRGEEDSQVVKNLREAGAIPLCVTNVPEFLLFWDSYNKIYGKTNNPYDKSRIPGGSSGGEAALIAAAGSVVGVGSDLGGSIRIPAFFCGIFGHKPTPGIVPISEVFPYVGHKQRERYIQVGPMCRYAKDLRPMLRGCAGKQDTLLMLDKELDLKQLNVFYMTSDLDPFKSSVSEDVLTAMERVVNFLDSKTGKPSEKVYLKSMKHGFMIWVCTLANIESPSLSHELTERTGEVSGWAELCKWFVGRSNFRLSTALNVILYDILNPNKTRNDKKFQKLVTKGEKLREGLTEMLGSNGVLLYPTLPETAPKHNGALLKSNCVGYTMIFNITGHPVTQVPLGLTKSGLPVGLQIVTNPFNDHLSIGVAELLESEFGGWVPPFTIKV